jgi:hypothetical protein
VSSCQQVIQPSFLVAAFFQITLSKFALLHIEFLFELNVGANLLRVGWGRRTQSCSACCDLTRKCGVQHNQPDQTPGILIELAFGGVQHSRLDEIRGL